jgi:NTP pyrophosphatase (non-canonical NTP hydrolase)
MKSRTESEVTDALAELITVARRSALLPKNIEKGHWQNLGIRDLLAIFLEEAGEVARAYNHGEPLESFVAEIGDAAWVLAMLLDSATGTKHLEGLIKAAYVASPTLDTAPGSLAAVTESGCALVVNASAVARLEIYGDEPPPPVSTGHQTSYSHELDPAVVYPGCHLELKLLDAGQACGACGFEAEQHRNWAGGKR